MTKPTFKSPHSLAMDVLAMVALMSDAEKEIIGKERIAEMVKENCDTLDVDYASMRDLVEELVGYRLENKS